MICNRCLRRAARSNALTHASTAARFSMVERRSFTSASTAYDQQPISPNTTQTSQPQRDRPAATSTGAAQPFSEAITPSPKATGTSGKTDKPKTRPASSVRGGTPLNGLNYFKNREDPIAMEDHEYPDWLWDVLAPKNAQAAGTKVPVDPRLFSKSANARRKANKRARAQDKHHSESAEKHIPIYEQSIDLSLDPSARQELTKAMRQKRRSNIKEANFLQQMR